MAADYWHRLQRRRISRRRLLASAAAGTTAVAAVAVLGRPKAVRAGGDSRYGGIYVFPTTFEWGTLDPLTSVAAGPQIFPRIYNTLVDRSRRDLDFYYLDLAETVEQPDEETCVFSIRPGVRIAPNDLEIPERGLDAFDAHRWLERVTEDEAAVLHPFAKTWIASFETPDAGTFVVRTAGPYGYFLLRLGNPVGGCIPPREFAERGISLRDRGAGAGPFGTIVPGSFSEFGGIIIQRNPNYYRTADGDQLPYLDRIQVLRISDRAARRLAFQDRQIYEYTARDRTEADELLAEIHALHVTEQPVNTFISLTMNPERPPWNDERIRKAALHALDRQEFVDRVVGPGAGRPNGLVHWPLGDFALPPEELEQLQSYDPALSRQLIQDATGQDTIDITVMYPANSSIEFHNRHLPIFLEQMAAAGFNVQNDPRDFTLWLRDYQSLDYDASLALNQLYDTPEIPLDFHAADGPTGNRKFAVGIGGTYPEVEEAVQQAKRTVDAAQQIEKVRAAQRLIYERGPAFLPIMSWIDFTLVHPFVKNPYQARGLGNTALYLSDWWLAADAPCPVLTGDVNCDGDVNSIDAALILQHHAGLLASLPCEYLADVNSDGRIDSIDAFLLLQYQAGLLTCLPR